MRYTIPPEQAGKRLREILRQELRLSYTALKSAKWGGAILLEGAPATVNAVVQAGQTVEIRWPERPPAYTPRPYQLSLEVLYRDEHFLVVNKPAPLASQSSAGHPDDSLENALYAYFGCPEGFIYRPVNRLDKGTSGLMVVALTAHAQHRLQETLHTADFQRAYLAVTEGTPNPPAGLVDAPIAKEKAASIRRVVDPAGKPSLTRYETLRAGGGRALVRLQLETGRTHQIRVHMAHLGCPVCGDFLYGSELKELPGRFALHSAELTLRHPFTGETLRWTSPLPDALARLL